MNKNLSFGRVTITDTSPVITIAEAACEHLGSLEVAKRMVAEAASAGADIIKFQLHIPEEMVPGSIRFWAGTMDEVLARYNLSIDDHKQLLDYCDKVGIQYLCTPFCAKAADILDDMGVQAFKTGSGEMTNIPMLRSIAKKKKPMIVSTGMATMEEIGMTVSMLKAEGAVFALTHCTSAYPPRYDQINLRVIPKLRDAFDVLVGHSDHTPDLWTALGAVCMGARIIEKHFTLDRCLKGPDYHVSLEPSEFRMMVDAIRKMEAALGDDKKIYEEELIVRNWAHHSVVAIKDIPAETTISPDMIGVKRPGSGIPAKHLDSLYGRVTATDIPANTVLHWDHLR